MSTLEIIKVENSRHRNFKDFVELPFNIYEKHSCWVPWFTKDIKCFVDRKHPIFEHTEGDFFIARRGNETLGRIFVFENKQYNKTHSKNSAHFFFLDLFKDRDTAETLFGLSVDWAKKRNLSEVLGPMGLGGVTGGGLLVEGFQHRASMTMMQYNHPYYQTLIEESGFEKYIDNFNFYLPTCAELPDGLRDAAHRLLEDTDFKVLTFNSKKDIAKIADDIIIVFMKTLSDHIGNYELTHAELSYLSKSLLSIADPELFKIMTHKDRVIGFLFGFHDLSAALQKGRGSLNPLTIYRIMQEYKSSDWLLINGIGILPEFQGTGANAVLYYELEKTIRKYPKFNHIEMVQIAENTVKMLNNVKTLMGQTHKTHRIFQYQC